MNMNKPPDETLKQGRNRSWLLVKYAQAKKYGPVPARKYRKSMEPGSSFPTEKSWGFFRRLPPIFPLFPTGKARKSAEKNSRNFRSKYCFHVASNFGVFLPDPVIA